MPLTLLGLTGSIAMGKSTVAGFFEKQGVPVFDYDRQVHALYAPGGRAVEEIKALFPEVIQDNAVDRTRLSALLLKTPHALQALEEVVFPLLDRQKKDFLETQKAQGAHLVVMDHPLLFEQKQETTVDHIVVVTAPLDLQRARALARPGMTPEKFDFLLSRQMPNALKCQKADWVLETHRPLEETEQAVIALLADIQSRHPF